jgi:hypothetical protein
MRIRQCPLPDDALATFHTVVHQTKDDRVFRRAQAVHAMVKGRPLPTVTEMRVDQFCSQQVWFRTLSIRVSWA